jgi:hypothetical protein
LVTEYAIATKIRTPLAQAGGGKKLCVGIDLCKLVHGMAVHLVGSHNVGYGSELLESISQPVIE